MSLFFGASSARAGAHISGPINHRLQHGTVTLQQGTQWHKGHVGSFTAAATVALDQAVWADRPWRPSCRHRSALVHAQSLCLVLYPHVDSGTSCCPWPFFFLFFLWTLTNEFSLPATKTFLNNREGGLHMMESSKNLATLLSGWAGTSYHSCYSWQISGR